MFNFWAGNTLSEYVSTSGKLKTDLPQWESNFGVAELVENSTSQPKFGGSFSGLDKIRVHQQKINNRSSQKAEEIFYKKTIDKLELNMIILSDSFNNKLIFIKVQPQRSAHQRYLMN